MTCVYKRGFSDALMFITYVRGVYCLLNFVVAYNKMAIENLKVDVDVHIAIQKFNKNKN
jgi:hypothetical protein